MSIAHLKRIPPNQWIIQSNEEHCNNVSGLSELFADEFHSGTWGKYIGLLHDLGKEHPEFQHYIRAASGFLPGEKYKRVHHAYVGAIAARRLFPVEPAVLSYCIMGHHAGLSDCGDFDSNMNEPFPEEVPMPSYGDVKFPFPFQFRISDIHLWVRMLFSCLVDADYLDTEAFMQEEQARLRKGNVTLRELHPRLNEYLQTLKSRAAETSLNAIRDGIQQECLRAAVLAPGFFSLTVPTGGGKTLSSLVWAVNHALKYNKKRVIIAIPYTSIIIQTAQILREIFGEENVLEHHSNAVKEVYKSEELEEKMKLTTQNWDAPIIVTTNVQLFESLFSNRPSKCRKLHNICNSIIILDEVQTLPLDYLRPIVECLKTLQSHFGVSVLFTTASQPAIDGEVCCGKSDRDRFEGIQGVHEIVADPGLLSRQLRRAKIQIDTQESTFDEISRRIAEHQRVLCIVTSRADAREIYDRLPEDGFKFHLSRMMCPVHIRETLEKIKKVLQSADAPGIRVVATQLIEAGVDIDFPTVFRQEAGLDSIIQAAGRCNREGLLACGNTYVFKLKQGKRIPFVSRAIGAFQRLKEERDLFDPITIKEYFRHLYYNINSFDKADISKKLYTKRDFYFKEAAEEFQLIDDKSIGVIVNYLDSVEFVEKLMSSGPSYSLMKELNQYTVNVREQDFKMLCKEGMIKEVLEGIYFLPEREQYNQNVGLLKENRWLDEILIK